MVMPKYDMARVETRLEPGEVRDRRTRTGRREVIDKVHVVVLPDGSEYRDHDGIGFSNTYAAECYARGWNDGRAAST
jgi:hypothetical protein